MNSSARRTRRQSARSIGSRLSLRGEPGSRHSTRTARLRHEAAPDMRPMPERRGLAWRARREMSRRQSGLVADDFDWLRRLKGAADTLRDLPPIPPDIAARLAEFGLV